MKKELIQRLHKCFEDSAHQNEGVEFLLARELQKLLGYMQWRNFEVVIDKARTISKMVDIGAKAQCQWTTRILTEINAS